MINMKSIEKNIDYYTTSYVVYRFNNQLGEFSCQKN